MMIRMKQFIKYSLSSVIILSVCMASLCAQSDAEIKSVQSMQVEVQGNTNDFLQRVSPVLDELVHLGASEEDVTLIKETLGGLQQVSEQEMAAILVALDAALDDTETEVVDDNLKAAFEGQGQVVEKLRLIFERFKKRQTELTIAAKAEALRRWQTENQHLTELLREGGGDRIEAQAEQRGLEDAINALVSEIEAIQNSGEQDGEVESLAIDASSLTALRGLSAQAPAQLESREYANAIQTQQALCEILSDLAVATVNEPPPKESLKNLLVRLKSILARQVVLLGSEVSEIATEQQRLSVETELLRIPVENVNAPAAFQVSSAAAQMREVLLAIERVSTDSVGTIQATAIQYLERAIELMEEKLDGLKEGDGEDDSGDEGDEGESGGGESGGGESSGEGDDGSAGDDLAELADIYQKANQLQNAQNQQNQGAGSASNQAAIAREAAELQSEALELSPEAARALGRAAARMAEALAPDLGESERESLEAAAAAQLAKATESILKEGRERRSKASSGVGDGSTEVVEFIALEEDILGPPSLSPAERAAIEVSRREPVSLEYAPLVEAYYDKLSRMSGANE